jgi:hypothetical protein
VFDSIKSLLQANIALEAMTHLELYRLWTPEKQKQIMKFLSKQQRFIDGKLDDLVSNKLPGYTISDYSIPVDNNEATISSIEDLRDFEIDWEAAKQLGPGWILVPFEFICDAGLDLLVYRSDAFSMPDWIHVSIGDFEEDYYFEGEGNRKLRVKGRFSFYYTKEELEASKLRLPASAGIEEDIDVELVEESYPDEM